MHEYQIASSSDGQNREDARCERASTSAAAITGLVLGILALATSALPIINNFSFVLAVPGLAFAVIGVVATVRRKKSGKGIAIAAATLNVIAVVVVLATQSMYSAAIDEAMSGPSVTGATDAVASDSSEDSSSAAVDYGNMTVGSAVELSNGLSVQVNSVQTGLSNYDGSPITGVTVTYVNNGSSEVSFNLYDWKGQDAQGAQRSTTYYSEATDSLNSGSLASGGMVSGSVYFEGDLVKVLYFSSMFSKSSQIAWTLT